MNTEEARIEKYFQFLKELKTALHYNEKFSISDLIKSHGVSVWVTKELSDGGIIKVIGRGRGSVKKWVSEIEPNMMMAKELSTKVRDSQKIYDASKRVEVTVDGPRGLETLKEAGKSIIRNDVIKKRSYFWGMFKFEEIKRQ